MVRVFDLCDISGSDKTKIGNLSVSVIEGDITDQRTDVIVASTTKELNLTKGLV